MRKEGWNEELQQLNNTLGATAGYTVRLLEGSISHPNTDAGSHGIKGDAWFGIMKSALVIGFRGHQVVLQVKGNSGIYPTKLLLNS